ncbi:MAG: response regulator [Oscillospiraceae bacterium]|nr:response regulator [Oscillospiraceae bacterium]
MPKLLIADTNEDFRLALADALQERCQVFTCASGPQALDFLRREAPELLVTELILQESDGLTLLEQLRREGIQTRVLVISTMLTDYVCRCLSALDVSYALRKPCPVSLAVRHVLGLLDSAAPHHSAEDDRSRVSGLLMQLHIATRHKGFSYLLEGILLLAEDPSQSITKELYSKVAKRCGCKRENVEHPMRNALELAWKRGDPQVWMQYFPNHTKRPSNAEFLSRMVQELLKRPE